MNSYDRKLDQRIIKRKEKVMKMIDELEINIKDMDPTKYQYHKEYLRELSSISHKLYRLKQELTILESGHLAQDI